jgi:hypothetical protein
MSEEKVLKAEYGSPDHPLELGGLKIPCYVLDDGTRVLGQSHMIMALGMSHGGSGGTGGDRLAKFVGQTRLEPYVERALAERTANPIKFRVKSGGIAYGYDATILADICEAVLKARDAGVLMKQQDHIAAQCEILVRGFARVGIIALVDEATGYQEIRDRLALQAILEKYLTDEWAKWTKTFPDEFYIELFRLRDVPYPPPGKHKNWRPSYVGHWTNDIVYSRLAPGVLKALKKKNPVTEKGYRKARHHQLFTRDYGHPAMKEHLANVIFLMRTCVSWADFKRRLDRAAPRQGDTIPLPFDD